jgi:hypothetical protein
MNILHFIRRFSAVPAPGAFPILARVGSQGKYFERFSCSLFGEVPGDTFLTLREKAVWVRTGLPGGLAARHMETGSKQRLAAHVVVSLHSAAGRGKDRLRIRRPGRGIVRPSGGSEGGL